jgi:hypothetical protein
MIVNAPEATAREWTFDAITDERVPFFFQVPAVAVHRSVLAALGVPEFCLVTLRRVSTNQTQAVWLVGDDDELWESCPTPWHKTACLSNAAWRAFALAVNVKLHAWKLGLAVLVMLGLLLLPLRMRRNPRGRVR